MRTKIFLASSSELEEDRKDFEIFINRKNKDWADRGAFLDLVVWENFLDALSRTRLQDEYNKAVRECDVFVMLFYTKVGKYTEEEFETAFGQFQATNKPIIYTYFKDAEITTGSANKDDLETLWAFQGKVKSLGHFYTVYKNVDALKFHFNQQLDKLAEKGFIELIADLTETYHDAQVESVRTQLIQLLPQPGEEEIFLRNKVFPILRTLFVGRNTFEEKIAECRDEVWTRRFIAAVETRQLMNAYKTKMVKLAKPGDDRLVQSYDQLKLHLYLQKLTGLFSPRPEVNQVAERLRHGDLEGVEKELRRAEIHPKERIHPQTISDCDEHQTKMREIWETWPVSAKS